MTIGMLMPNTRRLNAYYYLIYLIQLINHFRMLLIRKMIPCYFFENTYLCLIVNYQQFLAVFIYEVLTFIFITQKLLLKYKSKKSLNNINIKIFQL